MNLHRLITCYISKLRVLRSTSIIQVDMLKIFFFFFFFRFSPYNILQILLILSRTETQVLLFAPKSQHLMTKYVTKKKKCKTGLHNCILTRQNRAWGFPILEREWRARFPPVLKISKRNSR